MLKIKIIQIESSICTWIQSRKIIRQQQVNEDEQLE